MKRIIGALLLVGFALLGASGAAGHSALVAGDPNPDEVLKVMPPEVRLEFNETLMVVGTENPNKLEVLDANGAVVSGETKVEGQFISAPITQESYGYFTVRYRVASADGHPISGQYDFAVAGGEANVIAPAPSLQDPTGSPLLGILALGAVALTLYSAFRGRKRRR